MNTFFYGVLPYIALTIFVGGTIVRYTVFETEKGHFQIFFKAPNEANMNAAFEKYAATKLKKAERRESVLGKLEKFKALVKNAVVDRTKRKELER